MANLDYKMNEMKQLTPLDIKPEYNEEKFLLLIEPLKSGKKERIIFETYHQRKDGSTYPVEVRLQLSTDETPPVYVAIVQDITERKNYISELEHKALYDSLTDLPNRNLLQDRLNHLIKTSLRQSKSFAIAILDTDQLKDVNDILGHQNGDLVLQNIAKRLKKALRSSDTIARIGGDEFALLLFDVTPEQIPNLSRKLHQVFHEPFILENNPVEIETHIGFAFYPEHGDDVTSLLKHADIALRVAKSENLEYTIFDPNKIPFTLRNLQLLGELRHALNTQALELFYQPKVDRNNGTVTSVEGLARWQHPEKGMIAPNEFIPLIEHSGLIRPFTLWVLCSAISQCRQWKNEGFDLKVAVNLSTRNLLDATLPGEIKLLLKKYDVAPGNLKLEITETALMSSSATTAAIFKQLDEMGLEISIDDFGTGYSSLVHLKKLPLDELKIDQSFIKNLLEDENDMTIVHSMIELAHNLGLSVVAEGVEDEKTWNYLMRQNCDTGQGYYFSRPLPASEFTTWLKQSHWCPVQDPSQQIESR